MRLQPSLPGVLHPLGISRLLATNKPPLPPQPSLRLLQLDVIPFLLKVIVRLLQLSLLHFPRPDEPPPLQLSLRLLPLSGVLPQASYLRKLQIN